MMSLQNDLEERQEFPLPCDFHLFNGIGFFVILA
jgi:hypothetical protein